MIGAGGNHDPKISHPSPVHDAARVPIECANISATPEAASDTLQSQLSQEGRDCQNSQDNSEEKACIQQALQRTENDLAIFYQNLKGLLDSPNQTNLGQAQQQWIRYRQASCNAIDEFFREGSARVGMVARCQIQLARSRMKDLDAIYNLPLHH